MALLSCKCDIDSNALTLCDHHFDIFRREGVIVAFDVDKPILKTVRE